VKKETEEAEATNVGSGSISERKTISKNMKRKRLSSGRLRKHGRPVTCVEYCHSSSSDSDDSDDIEGHKCFSVTSSAKSESTSFQGEQQALAVEDERGAQADLPKEEKYSALQRGLLRVQEGAVQALEALLLGLHTLVQQQSIKDLTTASLGLSFPLAFPSSIRNSTATTFSSPVPDAPGSSVLLVSVERTAILILRNVFESFPWYVDT
jgi:hypothetical protein